MKRPDVVVPYLPLAMESLMLGTHGIIWCPYLHSMCYAISWFPRVFPVPGGVHEMSSASYLRVRNIIWTAAGCRKTGVKTNALVEVLLLGETNTCAGTCMCMCVHTHRHTNTHSWNKWSERLLKPIPGALAMLTWYSMTYSALPVWWSACPHPVLVGRKSSAAAGRGRAWGVHEPVTWRHWKLPLSWKNPFLSGQSSLYRWHEGGRGRWKKAMTQRLLVTRQRKRRASHSPPGSGLRWQLSISGIKSAFSSSSAPPETMI